MKRLIFICAGIAILALMVFLLPSFFSWKEETDLLVKRMEEETLATITVANEVSASFFPTPEITLYDVTLKGAHAEGLIDVTVPVAKVKLSIAKLLTGNVEPTELTLKTPTILLTRPQPDPVTGDMPEPAAQQMHLTMPLPLSIQNGTMQIRSSADMPPKIIQPINATLSMQNGNGPHQLMASFPYHNVPLTIAVTYTPPAPEATTTPFSLQIADEKNLLKAEGKMTNAGPQSHFEGTLSLDITTLKPVAALFSEKWNNTDAPALETPPLRLQGPIDYKNGLLELHKVVLSMGESRAELAGSVQLRGKESSTLNIAVDQFELDPLGPVIAQSLTFLRQGRIATTGDTSNAASMVPMNYNPLFAPDSRMDLALQAKKLTLRAQALSDVAIKARLQNGEWTIDEAHAQLPHEATLAMSGTLSETREGLRFMGKSESSGKSLRGLMEWWGIPVSGVDASLLKDFTVSGGLTWQSEELRLSDMEGVIDEQPLFATLIYKSASATTQNVPSLEAALNFRQLNVDRYLKPASWLPTEEQLAQPQGQIAIGWLHSLPISIHVNAVARELRFRGMDFTNARLRMNAAPNVLEFPSIIVQHGDHLITSRMKLTNAPVRPKIAMVLIADALDTADILSFISMEPKAANAPEAAKKEFWSSEPFDLRMLDLADGSIAAEIKRLTHQGEEAQQVTFKGNLENRTLSVSTLTGRVLDGRLAMTAKLEGGSVPSLHTEFSLDQIDIARIVALKLPTPPMHGNITLSGVVSAQGISPKSMISTSDGNLQFGFNELRINGIDIGSLTRRVMAARSVDDVTTLSRSALTEGTTLITSLSGGAAIRKGQLQIAQAALQADYTEGHIASAIDLDRMVMNMQIAFRPTTRTDEALPPVNLRLIGSVAEPRRELDTTALEDFVAKRAVKRKF